MAGQVRCGTAKTALSVNMLRLPPKSVSISSSPAAGSRPDRARGKYGISQTSLQIGGSQV